MEIKNEIMDVPKLKTILDQIIAKIETQPESAYDYFYEEWSKLYYDEKEVLKPFLAQYYLKLYNDMEIGVEKKMYMAEIEVSIGTEYSSNRFVNRLILTDNTTHTKDVQIAKLFYELKTYGHITNTLEELAAFIANSFNLDYDTIYKYLTHPSDSLKKAKPLF
jgi:hypothetical protein